MIEKFLFFSELSNGVAPSKIIILPTAGMLDPLLYDSFKQFNI